MKAKRIPFGAAGVLLALLSLLMFVAGCSDDGDDADPAATESAVVEPTDAEPTADIEPADEPAASETTIDVSLTEWAMESSESSAPAGTITFNATNDGAIFHNLTLIATDLAPDALPTDEATFQVNEEQVDVIAHIEDLDPDEQGEVTADLEAGSYVLICNVPTHYDAGMTVTFTVE